MGALLFYQSTHGGSQGCCLQELFPGVTLHAPMHGWWQLSGVTCLEFAWSILVVERAQRDICEVTQYLLKDTGISGPLKFLLAQFHMKSLLPNKKRISNQERRC